MFASVMGSRSAPEPTGLPPGIQTATSTYAGNGNGAANGKGNGGVNGTANGAGHGSNGHGANGHGANGGLNGTANGASHVTNGSAAHVDVGAVSEGKRLIVGPGISLSGEITACDRLVVQGSVQVTLNETRAIEITEAGRFTNGRAEVEEAEVSGVYEGELTVRRRLLVRGSGRVTGTIRYGELEIERGGLLSGAVSRLEGKASAPNVAEPKAAEKAAEPKPAGAKA